MSCILEIVAQIHNVEDSNFCGYSFFPTPNGWIVVDAAGIHFLQLYQGPYILKVGISGNRDSANFFHFPPKFRLRTRKP